MTRHFDVIIIGSGAGGDTLFHALAPTGIRPALFGRAEVEAAGKLANDHHIRAFEHLGLHGAVAEEERMDADRPEVRKEAELLAHAEDGVFRADGGPWVVPLRAADGAE